MVAFNMALHADGNPQNKADRVHIMKAKKSDNAWDRYESYRAGHHQGAKYGLPANPFLDWDVAQRYAHQSDVAESRVKPHRMGAGAVHALIKAATVEGLI